MIPLKQGAQNSQIQEIEDRVGWLPGARRREMRNNNCLIGYRVLAGEDEDILEIDGGDGCTTM